MDALSLHRIGHWLYLRRVPLLPKLLQGAIFFLFSSYIPYQLQVGAGTRLGHRGIGVVINKDAVIGRNVLVRAHVAIGKKETDGPAPRIGDSVTVGDGAKILGDISIGDDAIIGANAFVIHDLLSGATAVGVSAKILEVRG